MSGKSKDLENFCHNVVWLRKHYAFTKKKMAEIMRISVRSLNLIESGDIPPRLDVEVLFFLGDAFYISPHLLLKYKIEEVPADKWLDVTF